MIRWGLGVFWCCGVLCQNLQGDNSIIFGAMLMIQDVMKLQLCNRTSQCGWKCIKLKSKTGRTAEDGIYSFKCGEVLQELTGSRGGCQENNNRKFHNPDPLQDRKECLQRTVKEA